MGGSERQAVRYLEPGVNAGGKQLPRPLKIDRWERLGLELLLSLDGGSLAWQGAFAACQSKLQTEAEGGTGPSEIPRNNNFRVPCGHKQRGEGGGTFVCLRGEA